MSTLQIILNSSSFCVLLLIVCFLFFVWKKIDIVAIKKTSYRASLYKNYPMLEHLMDSREKFVFDLLYKKEIALQVLSNHKPTQEEIVKFQKTFVMMFIEMIGKEIVNDWVLLMGDYDSLCSMLAYKFNLLYESTVIDMGDLNDNIAMMNDDSISKGRSILSNHGK